MERCVLYGVMLGMLALVVAGCGSRAVKTGEVVVPPTADNPQDEIVIAAKFNDLAKVKDLLSRDPSLANARAASGDTPLHAAARMGNAAIVKALIAAGADVNAVNGDGYTPLGAAEDVGAGGGVSDILSAAGGH